MKILLIGYGNMGKNHYRAIEKLLQTTEHTTKVCDTNIENKTDYIDYKLAINDMNPDFVIIATPTETHVEILDYCISKNIKNVFVEKPIILNGDPYKYLNQPITRIMVGHIERYNPVVRYLKQMLEGKRINTIICVRSGLKSNKDYYDLHTDLCVHDTDVVQFLTKGYSTQIEGPSRRITTANRCELFTEINGVSCFIHADKKNLHKRRYIVIIGEGFIAEADYITQTLIFNGEHINISKCEPLLTELETFFARKYTEEDLEEAINNLKLVGA